MKTLEPCHFRPLSLNDLSEMMEIERDIFISPWSASQMRDSLRAAHCQVWGIYLDQSSKLIGYGILSLVLDEAELLSIGIAKSYQRRGLGEQLLIFLLKKATDAKAQKIFLEVPASNEGAAALYQKHQFQELGVREAYYRVPGQSSVDAILMCLQMP